MIRYGIENFLDARAQNFAKLIGNQFMYGGFGTDPSGRLLIEQYEDNPPSWGLDGGGDNNRIFQPGTQPFFSEDTTPAVDRAFIGQAFMSIHADSLVPAEYTMNLNMIGVSMGSDETGEGTINTTMRIWQSTNVVNTLQVGQVVLIEIPAVPFQWLRLTMVATDANIQWPVSVSFMGLQMKR